MLLIRNPEWGVWSSMLGFLNGSLTLQSCHRMGCWILTPFSGASSLLYLLSLLVGKAAAPRRREAPRLNEGWSMRPHLPTVGTIFLAFEVLPIWLLKMVWLGRKTPSSWGNDSFFPLDILIWQNKEESENPNGGPFTPYPNIQSKASFHNLSPLIFPESTRTFN